MHAYIRDCCGLFSTQNDTDSQFLIPGLSVKDG